MVAAGVQSSTAGHAFIPVTLLTARGEIVPLARLGGPNFSIHLRASRRKLLSQIGFCAVFMFVGATIALWGLMAALGLWAHPTEPVFLFGAGVLFAGVGIWAARAPLLVWGRRLRMRFAEGIVDVTHKSRMNRHTETLPLAAFSGLQVTRFYSGNDRRPDLVSLCLVQNDRKWCLPLFVGKHTQWDDTLPDRYASRLGVSHLPDAEERRDAGADGHDNGDPD